jgi:TetR/AcrR family transcriptional repressor of nem operon
MSDENPPVPANPQRARSRKERSRARILDAAARLFRRHGYNGVGLMTIMKAAELTPGAFYAHFESKEHLFAEVVGMRAGPDASLAELRAMFPVGDSRALAVLLDHTLENGHAGTAFAACTLAALAGDIARSGPQVRARFEGEMRKLFEEIAGDLPQDDGDTRLDAAIAALALASGGVAMAQAMADEALAVHILTTCRDVARELARGPAPDDPDQAAADDPSDTG